MDSNLVSAARADFYIEQTETGKLFRDRVLRPSTPPRFDPRGHTRSPDRVTRDRTPNDAVRTHHVAVHQCDVVLLNSSRLKLISEGLMRLICTRYYQDPACFFIEPVDNSRAQVSANLGQFAEVVQQCVNQRALMMACAGMDNHPSRLIDHNHVRIFVENL